MVSSGGREAPPAMVSGRSVTFGSPQRQADAKQGGQGCSASSSRQVIQRKGVACCRRLSATTANAAATAPPCSIPAYKPFVAGCTAEAHSRRARRRRCASFNSVNLCKGLQPLHVLQHAVQLVRREALLVLQQQRTAAARLKRGAGSARSPRRHLMQSKAEGLRSRTATAAHWTCTWPCVRPPGALACTP